MARKAAVVTSVTGCPSIWSGKAASRIVSGIKLGIENVAPSVEPADVGAVVGPTVLGAVGAELGAVGAVLAGGLVLTHAADMAASVSRATMDRMRILLPPTFRASAISVAWAVHNSVPAARTRAKWPDLDGRVRAAQVLQRR